MALRSPLVALALLVLGAYCENCGDYCNANGMNEGCASQDDDGQCQDAATPYCCFTETAFQYMTLNSDVSFRCSHETYTWKHMSGEHKQLPPCACVKSLESNLCEKRRGFGELNEPSGFNAYDKDTDVECGGWVHNDGERVCTDETKPLCCPPTGYTCDEPAHDAVTPDGVDFMCTCKADCGEIVDRTEDYDFGALSLERASGVPSSSRVMLDLQDLEAALNSA